MCVTGGFQGFDLFYVLTNGGPYGATEIPTTYLVKAVFRNRRGRLRLGDGGHPDGRVVVWPSSLVYARCAAPPPRPGEAKAA